MVSSKNRKVLEYSYIQKDETVIKVGSELIWLWVAIEIESKKIIEISISKERNMFVAKRFQFISNIVDEYGHHPVSTDGGTWYPQQACQFLKLPNHVHFLYIRI